MKQYFRHGASTLIESLGSGTVLSKLCSGFMETDSDVNRTYRRFNQDGVLSGLGARIGDNTRTTTSTLSTKVGGGAGSAGNQSVSFLNTDSNVFKRDDSNTDAVTATDLWAFIHTMETGTGTIGWNYLVGTWEADEGSITLLGDNSAGSTGFTGNGTTYMPPAGFRSTNPTEAQASILISSGGTWRNLACMTATVTANAATTVTFRSRVNAAGGNMSVVLGSTTAETIVYDDSNTDTVASGDKLSWRIVTANRTSGTYNTEGTYSQINHSADETLMLVGGQRQTINVNQTVYSIIAGSTRSSSHNSTESNTQHVMSFDATASRFGCAISQNSGAYSATMTMRNGAADVNQSIALSGAGATVIDDSNTDDLLADDLINVRIFSPSGGTNFRPQAYTMVLTATESGATRTAEGVLESQAAVITASAGSGAFAVAVVEAQLAAIVAEASRTAKASAAMAAQSSDVIGSATVGAGAGLEHEASGVLASGSADVGGAVTIPSFAAGVLESGGAVLGGFAKLTRMAAGVLVSAAASIAGRIFLNVVQPKFPVLSIMRDTPVRATSSMADSTVVLKAEFAP